MIKSPPAQPPAVAAERPAPAASSQARDAGVLVFGRVVATLSDALLPLVIVRLLGKSEVGVLTSVLLLYGTVALVLSTGFPSALLYYLAGKPLPQRRAISLQIGLGLLAFGVLAAAAIGSSGLLPVLAPHFAARLFKTDSAALVQGGFGYLFLLSAFPLGDLPARMIPNLLVAESRADLAARYAVARSVANALFVLVPASAGAGIRSVLLSYSAFGLLQGAALLYFFRKLYRTAERIVTPIGFREIARFAVPLGMTDIAGMLSSRLDRYLISVAFPLAAFAEYQAGAFQIPILTTIAYTVGTVYAPAMTELIANQRQREAIDIWRANIGKVALIVVPVSAVFVIAAEEFVRILFTDAYVRAAPVFRCYALVTMGRVTAYGTMLVSAGRPGLIFRSAVLTLVSVATLCIGGLYLFGFIGPALGVLAAYLPMTAIYCYYISRALELRFSEVFPLLSYLKVVGLTVVAAVPALLIKLMLPLSPLPMFAAIAVSLLGGFVLLGLLTGLVTRADLRYAARFVRHGGG